MLSITIFTLLLTSLTSAFSIGGGQQVIKTSTDDLKVPGNNPLEYCEVPNGWVLDIAKVDLDPNPPQAGQNLTITASGTLKQPIEQGAYAHISVDYNRFIHIFNQKVDLCEQMKNLDLECPINDGRIKIVKVVTLPSMVPSGKYDVFADVYTVDDKKITCIKTTVEFP